jgi:hypothetical protein
VDLIIIFPVFSLQLMSGKNNAPAQSCSNIFFSFHSIVSPSFQNTRKYRLFSENVPKYSSILVPFFEAANGLHAADPNHDRPKQGQDQNPPIFQGLEFGCNLELV